MNPRAFDKRERKMRIARYKLDSIRPDLLKCILSDIFFKSSVVENQCQCWYYVFLKTAPFDFGLKVVI